MKIEDNIQVVDLDAISVVVQGEETVDREVWRQSDLLSDEIEIRWDTDVSVPGKFPQKDWKHPLKALKLIEFNPTELCNRTCRFCPRTDADIYPNRNLQMQVHTVKAVIDDVVPLNYRGEIVFSGMGEPLLNPDIVAMVAAVPDNIHTQIVTNGDRLLKGSIPGYGQIDLQDFIDAGLTHISIDVYDNDAQFQEVLAMCEPHKGKLIMEIRPRFLEWMGHFNNRAGTVSHVAIKNRVSTRCYTPSVKAFIDWDGTLQLCCQDWQRLGGSFGNVNMVPFHELWMHKRLMDQRKKLMNASRLYAGSPCNQCSAQGNTRDKDSCYPIWDKYFIEEALEPK
jgi:MoaA/NifB/PqqE/SkfB family radical SAM enzyme